MSVDITLQISKNDFSELDFKNINSNIEILESKAFDGKSAIISVLIAVTPLVAPEVTKVLQSYIDRNKNIVVIHNGTEYRGLSKEEVLEFIDALKVSGD